MSDDRKRSTEDRLRDLKALHADGLMTDAEYSEKLQLVADQLDETQAPKPTPPSVEPEPTATPEADVYEPCATPGCYEKRIAGSFCPKHRRSKVTTAAQSMKKSPGGWKSAEKPSGGWKSAEKPSGGVFYVASGLLIVIFIVLVFAFGGGDSTPSNSPSAGSSSNSPSAGSSSNSPSAGSSSGLSSSGREGDASANLACSHFRNVAGDASAGILSDSELRQKLKEVNDDAKVSNVSSVRRAAQSMLSAVTSGSIDSLSSAVSSMGAACASVGY